MSIYILIFTNYTKNYLVNVKMKAVRNQLMEYWLPMTSSDNQVRPNQIQVRLTMMDRSQMMLKIKV